MLDTGILVAALITRDTPSDQLYQLWRKRRFTLITSELTKRGPSCAGCVRELLLSQSCHRSILSTTPTTISCLPLLSPAKADYLVTGDRRHLLHLKKVQQTRILTARELTELLN